MRVTCWTGAPGTDRDACGDPTGAAGLATVFPSMERCVPPTSPLVAGKSEVYECYYDGYMVRYTRWMNGFDRYGHYDRSTAVAGTEWWLEGEFAGRQWKGYERGPDEPLPYQWSATYRDEPYSITVEGVSDGARARGSHGFRQCRRVAWGCSERVRHPIAARRRPDLSLRAD